MIIGRGLEASNKSISVLPKPALRVGFVLFTLLFTPPIHCQHPFPLFRTVPYCPTVQIYTGLHNLAQPAIKRNRAQRYLPFSPFGLVRFVRYAIKAPSKWAVFFQKSLP